MIRRKDKYMKKYGIILTVLVALIPLNCYAKDELTFISDTSVIVEGQADGAGKISITVLKPGYDLETFNSVQNKEDAIVEYNQTTADAAGKYSFEIDFGGISDTYETIIGEKLHQEPRTISVKYINKSNNESVLAELQTQLNSKNETAVAAILKNSGNDLGVSKELRTNLSEEDYSQIADLLCVSNVSVSTKEPDVAAKIFDKAFAIRLLNNKQIKIENHESVLDLPENISSVFSEKYVTSSTKEYIYERLEKTALSFEEFDKKCARAVALGVIRDADGYGSIKSYLIENASLLEINVSKVTNAFAKSVIGKVFNTFDDIKINEFVEPSTPINGGGGGSSGGRSISGGITTTIPQPIDKPDDTKSNETGEDNSFYSDMRNYNWAVKAVGELTKLNIISGRGDGIFAPADNIKREEFVKMVLLAGNFETLVGDINFSDVNTSDWFFPYVKNAYLCGIAKGISSIEFGSGIDISRQDMAVMCHKLINISGKEIANTMELQFEDKNDIAEYARDSVMALYNCGIIKGDENNYFNPCKNANRAEAAQMVYNAYHYINQ